MEVSQVIRIEIRKKQTKKCIETTKIYICKCRNLDCNKEMRVYGITFLKRGTGYCKYCAPKFLNVGKNTQVLVHCANCNKDFYQKRHVYLDQLGRPSCCCNGCKFEYNSKNPRFKYSKDEKFFAMKFQRMRSMSKKRNIHFDIEISDLIELWKEQKGICKYTNIPMTIDNEPKLTHVSVDRVDNRIGYIKSNIVLCCHAVNTIKFNFDRGKFLDFIKLIYENYEDKNKEIG